MERPDEVTAGRAGLLRLVRWPGVTTAAADALAAAWMFTGCGRRELFAAGGAAGLLYAGGVVLNDVADADRDRILHPGRPLPAGGVSRRSAAAFGLLLLAAGVGVAAFAGRASLLAFGGVAVAVLAYDFVLKRNGLAGAIGMGLCRGGSALAAALACAAFRDRIEAVPVRAVLLAAPWFLAGAAVTAASLLEEHPRRAALAPWAASGIVAAPALGAVLLADPLAPLTALAVVPWLLLVGACGIRVAPVRSGGSPAAVGLLVREGVFGFLLLDATLLAARGHHPQAAAAVVVWIVLRRLLRGRRS